MSERQDIPRCWIELRCKDEQAAQTKPTESVAQNSAATDASAAELRKKTAEKVAAVNWTDVLSVEYENTLFLAADSVDITLRNSELLSDYLRKDMDINLWLGYVDDARRWDKSELTHVFSGKVDGVKAAFGKDMTVRLIGRDYSADLIDCEFSTAFAERTASQIAELLADKHKLTPKVAATTAIVEKDVYKDKKDWAVLQLLADREGFICYVTKERELYFGPRDEGDPTKIDMTLTYRDQNDAANSKLIRIDFDDAVFDIINQVVVRHWDGGGKKLVEATAERQDLIDKYGKKERVFYSHQAKTKELAQQEAERRLNELSRAVITAGSVQTLGNPTLGTQNLLKIAGCGRFDGPYYIERVKHRLAANSGYDCELELTNLLPKASEQYREELYPNEEDGDEM